MADRVEAFLEDIRLNKTHLFPIVARLREIILSCGDDVAEEFKYGGLIYSAKEGFCGIFAYAAHVSLEFSEGHALSDPEGRLQGNGKLRRHLKCSTSAAIDSQQSQGFIEQAYRGAGSK